MPAFSGGRLMENRRNTLTCVTNGMEKIPTHNEILKA